MKGFFTLFPITLFLSLTACSKVPSECEDLWKKIDTIAKESGIPEDALKEQKKKFDEQIKQLPYDDASKNCKIQLSVLN